MCSISIERWSSLSSHYVDVARDLFRILSIRQQPAHCIREFDISILHTLEYLCSWCVVYACAMLEETPSKRGRQIACKYNIAFGIPIENEIFFGSHFLPPEIEKSGGARAPFHMQIHNLFGFGAHKLCSRSENRHQERFVCEKYGTRRNQGPGKRDRRRCAATRKSIDVACIRVIDIVFDEINENLHIQIFKLFRLNRRWFACAQTWISAIFMCEFRKVHSSIRSGDSRFEASRRHIALHQFHIVRVHRCWTCSIIHINLLEPHSFCWCHPSCSCILFGYEIRNMHGPLPHAHKLHFYFL